MFNRQKSTTKFVRKINPLISSNDHSIENIFNTLIKNGQDKTALIWEENGITKRLTYSDLSVEVNRYSNKIHYLFHNLKEGSIILLKLPNSKDWVITYFSILKAGYKPFFINPSLSEKDTISLIKETHASGSISYKKENLQIKSFTLEEIKKCEYNIPNNNKFQNEIIFSTSGTTGKSRVFVFNGESIISQLETSLLIPLETNDVLYENKKESLKILGITPFYHVFGFFTLLGWHLFYNSTIVFPKENSIKGIIETVKKYRVTHIYYVPLFFDTIAKQIEQKIKNQNVIEKNILKQAINKTLSNIKLNHSEKKRLKKLRKEIFGNQIKFLISGGGQVLISTLKLLNGIGYPLHNGFGMTETAITSVELSQNIQDRIKGGIGHALSPVRYKLVIPKEDPKISELYIESKTVHVKRFENGKIILNDITKAFPTGDIAAMDSDGKFYIKGRIKDIIISSNGENVYPQEVESEFMNVENLDSFCVFGGSKKDSNIEKVILVYEIKENLSDEKFKKIFKDLETINATLPPNKKVDEFLYTKGKLPIVNNMKISRIKLKDMYLKSKDQFCSVKEPRKIEQYKNFTKEEILKVTNELKKLFASHLDCNVSKIREDYHWINDLGGNSLTYVDLINDIQKHFKINIPQEKYGLFTTVNDFIIEVLEQNNK